MFPSRILGMTIALWAPFNILALPLYDQDPVLDFNCKGVRDGNYQHPFNCNKYMSCSGGIASEKDCPLCEVNPVQCPDGMLIYNVTRDRCLPADETECVAPEGLASFTVEDLR